MVGRVAPNELELREVHRFPNEPVRLPDGLHWDILRLYREVLGRAARSRQAPTIWPASGSTRGASTTACSDEAGSLLGDPYHYRDGRTAARPSTRSMRRHPAGRAVCPDRDSSSCRSTRSTSSRRRAGRPALASAADDAAHPGPDRLLAVGRAGHRGHQRVDDGTARRAPPDVGHRAHRVARPARPDLSRRSGRPATSSARCATRSAPRPVPRPGPR